MSRVALRSSEGYPFETFGGCRLFVGRAEKATVEVVHVHEARPQHLRFSTKVLQEPAVNVAENMDCFEPEMLAGAGKEMCGGPKVKLERGLIAMDMDYRHSRPLGVEENAV